MIPLEIVVRTEELARRPPRPPDYETQSQALTGLSRSLARSPHSILESLCLVAQKVCRAGSAGVSLLSQKDQGTRFFWPAITGEWRERVGSGTPRDFGPCGIVLDRDCTQLFARPERYYPYIRGLEPVIEEALLAPFYVAGKAVGTVWVLSHDSNRHFDTEDQRQLESIAAFASGAYQVIESIGALEEKSRRLQQNRAELHDALEATQRLLALVARLNATADLKSALEEILAAAIEIGRAAKGAVHLVDSQHGVLAIGCQRGFDSEFLRQLESADSAGETTCARALRTGLRASVSDIRSDPEYAPYVEGAVAAGYRAVQSTPLVGSDGEILGILSTFYSEPRGWTKSEFNLLDLYAREAARALERNREQALLQEAASRLQATLSAGEIATWVWECASDRVFADQNLARMFSVSPQHAAGGPVSEYLKAIHPGDRDRVAAAIAEVLDGRRNDYQIEYRLQRSDGATRWVVARGQLHRDAHGKPKQFPGVVIDITERKRAEQGLLDADQRKNEFLAMLAHELRNPLAPIRNGVRILEQEIDPIRLPPIVAMMHRQVDHMTRLIEDLLDVSRVSQGKIDLRRERIDLIEVLHQAIDANRAAIERHKHELTLTLPGRPVYLQADATRLAQLLGNLLNNACKFTGRGGRIQVIVQPQGAETLVRVRDSGIGLSAEQLPRVFDLFAQADTSLQRPESGLGIGLTLVKRLVEMHGGSVRVASEGLGHGAEFTVRLPVAPDDGPADRKPDAAQPITPRRVLIVDDNRDAAETLAMLLQMDGHGVRVTVTGEEALKVIDEGFEPDFVLLDIGLPGMNGYEVARQIRVSYPKSRTRLIALTGWGQADDRTRSFDAGFDAHLVKPADRGALAKLLADASPR
jgi:PAS domain S-box-containing protein